MRYYFIAVNFNGFDFTKEYIDSVSNIKKAPEDEIHIIIVDNASNENDKEKLTLIKKHYNNLKIVFSSDNLGYFKGLNKGIELVRDDRDSIIIVGNNDLTFDHNFIDNFKRINYASDVLVVAPNIVTKDGRQQNPLIVKKISRVHKIKTAIYYSNYYVGQTFRFINQNIKKLKKKPVSIINSYGQMKIKLGIGACYILTPYFFEHYKKLDDRVFMWGEEALLANQVEIVGGTILYDPTIKITHHESASVKSIQSKKKYYMVKESYKVYKRYL